jgi:hypothetical protein
MKKSADMINTIDIINAIIKNIERNGLKSTKDKENYFWKNHTDTCNKYPFLVSQLCSGGDTKILDMMIEKLKEIENGDITMNKADEEIGQILSDKYLPN